MARIWVYAEVESDGKVNATSLELLTKARTLGDTEAVVLGPGASQAASTLGAHGAQTVYASDDATYTDYVAQPAAHALCELIDRHAPDLILFATDYDSRDVASRVSAKVGTTVWGNATDVLAPDRAQMQIFGGTKIVTGRLTGGSPKLVLVRPKSFAAEASNGSSPNVVQVDVQIPEEAKKAKRVERHAEEASGPKLEEARVVVSGGRGLQDPGNFDLLDQVSKLIPNCAVGATRAVVDAGWVPYSMQVGQTGKTVKPEVYIAAGISGASQHQVGMKESKNIIAINKDPEAPIFQLSDLGIVGDVLKVLPALIEEVKKRKGS